MDDIVFRLEREAAREPNEPIWRDAAMEIKALRHAVETLLGETEDSDYMSAAEQRELARKALHNPAISGDSPLDGVVMRNATTV